MEEDERTPVSASALFQQAKELDPNSIWYKKQTKRKIRTAQRDLPDAASGRQRKPVRVRRKAAGDDVAAAAYNEGLRTGVKKGEKQARKEAPDTYSTPHKQQTPPMYVDPSYRGDTRPQSFNDMVVGMAGPVFIYDMSVEIERNHLRMQDEYHFQLRRCVGTHVVGRACFVPMPYERERGLNVDVGYIAGEAFGMMRGWGDPYYIAALVAHRFVEALDSAGTRVDSRLANDIMHRLYARMEGGVVEGTQEFIQQTPVPPEARGDARRQVQHLRVRTDY